MRFLLYPFSIIYGLIIDIRNFLFDYEIIPHTEFQIPVISVGNITVGGTGKTPHVEYLINLLKNDYKIAVLSRGYKRKSRGFIVVDENMSAKHVGDESLQIKQKFPQITVAVDRNRVNGINQLISNKVEQKLDVILLDDAYQHRYVKPGLSILLVDYNRLITTDFLLPYGRLREPAYEKKRADIILITKCKAKLQPIEKRIIYKDFNTFPYQHMYFTGFEYENLKNIFSNTTEDINKLINKNTHIILITGIANSKYLLDYLNKLSENIKHLKYSDHYGYRKKDLMKIEMLFNNIKSDNKIILTTEKDAIRLKDIELWDSVKKIPFYFLPVKVTILHDNTDDFNQHIINFTKFNKRDRIISTKR